MRVFALPFSILFAALSLVLNPVWLAAAFSEDGHLAANTRFKLYICEGFLGAASVALFFMRERKQTARETLRAVAALVIMGTIAWGTVETACYVWNRLNPDLRSTRIEAQYHNHVRPHTVRDETMGYKAAPGGHVTASTWLGNTLVSRATYATDLLSRRLNPRDTSDRNKAAIFFGCSFTFGSGVENHETLPSHFSEFADEYRSVQLRIRSLRATADAGQARDRHSAL